MILGYLFKRLRRHVGEVLLSAMIIAVIGILLLGLHDYHAAQQAKLDAAYEDFEIRCTVTNAVGSKETDLKITSGYVALFEEGGTLFPQVTDVMLLRAFEGTLGAGKTLRCFMTTDPEATPQLRDVFIQYEEGHGGEEFRGTEAVCIISDRLSRYIGEQGTFTLGAEGGEIECRVIGSYPSEEDTVFVAWYPMAETLTAVGISQEAHSLSFTVADNDRLGELKELLRDYFIPASRTNKSTGMHGLIVDDSLFIDSVVVLERTLALLGVVRVLVYILSVGISFFVAYLGIRTRRLELAVMRSMGTRTAALYGEVLAEHVLFFLLGGAVSCLLALPLGMPIKQDHLVTIGVFMICYLIGVALAVAQATSGQIMQILKGKE